MVIGLQALVVVGPEIELEGDVDPRRAGLDVRPHLRGAGHQVLARVVLAHEIDAELAVGEVLRRPHDRGEELLLEGEPFDLVVETLGALAAVADVLGLLVIREVVVQAGVLTLVLVALLHPRNDGLEVHVDAAHVARDQVLHVHEGEHLVHRVGVLHQGVGFLDVTAAREREAHHDGGIGGGLRDILEVELPGVHGGRGVHDEAQLGLAFREDVQVRLVVGLIVLHAHGERLGAHRGEDDLQLLVLEGDGLSLGVGGGVQQGIAVHGRLRGQGGDDGVLRMLGEVGGADAVLLVGLDARYRIKLRLPLLLLADLPALVTEEADHEQGDQDPADD